MRRSFQSGKRMRNQNNIFHKGNEYVVERNRRFPLSKGQWFLISAVIASGIFLAISILLQDYFKVPPAVGNEEQIYFDDIKNMSVRVIQIDCAKQGGPILLNRENLTEYIHFAGEKMGGLGYLVNITPKALLECNKGTDNFHVLILKSEKADVWNGTRPEVESVLVNPLSAILELTIDFKDNDAITDYTFSVNVSAYTMAGFKNSRIAAVSPPGIIVINFDFPGAADDVMRSEAQYIIINSMHLIGKRRWELV